MKKVKRQKTTGRWEGQNVRTWSEFQQSGMLWWTNRLLQTLGWSIALEKDGAGNYIAAHPVRTRRLGFTRSVDTEGIERFDNHLNREAGE